MEPHMDPVTHRELAAWQAAIALASKVYGATATLPSADASGLAEQLRRASAAVPTQIAEGATRDNRQEFMQALRRARGWLVDLETHLHIAGRQRLVADPEPLLDEIQQLTHQLGALLRRLSERRVPETYFRPLATTSDRRPRVP
jgi:four helix bundle protein